VVAGVYVAALMMEELISKEKRGASAQHDRRVVVKGCINGDNEVIIGSLSASDGWCGDGGGQDNRGQLL